MDGGKHTCIGTARMPNREIIFSPNVWLNFVLVEEIPSSDSLRVGVAIGGALVTMWCWASYGTVNKDICGTSVVRNFTKIEENGNWSVVKRIFIKELQV